MKFKCSECKPLYFGILVFFSTSIIAINILFLFFVCFQSFESYSQFLAFISFIRKPIGIFPPFNLIYSNSELYFHSCWTVHFIHLRSLLIFSFIHYGHVSFANFVQHFTLKHRNTIQKWPRKCASIVKWFTECPFWYFPCGISC